MKNSKTSGQAFVKLCFAALVFFTAFAACFPCLQGPWQCTPAVSQDFNYVSCIDQECVCRSELGFDGNATAESPCRCDSPKDVYWKNKTPFCLSFEQAVEQSFQNKRQELLQAKSAQIYENLIFPTPILIMNGQISVDDLIAPDAQGRVNPLGIFDPLKDLYGLANTPTATVTAVNFLQPLRGVDGFVYSRVSITVREASVNGFSFFNLTLVGSFKFGEDDRVELAELEILNLGRAVDPVPDERASEIQSFCIIQTQVPGICGQVVDPLGFYSSFEDCNNYLSNLPFGTFDRVPSNTAACRLFYGLLTPYNPALYCPAAGKTGGGKCIDIPYEDLPV